MTIVFFSINLLVTLKYLYIPNIFKIFKACFVRQLHFLHIIRSYKNAGIIFQVLYIHMLSYYCPTVPMNVLARVVKHNETWHVICPLNGQRVCDWVWMVWDGCPCRGSQSLCPFPRRMFDVFRFRVPQSNRDCLNTELSWPEMPGSGRWRATPFAWLLAYFIYVSQWLRVLLCK